MKSLLAAAPRPLRAMLWNLKYRFLGYEEPTGKQLADRVLAFSPNSLLELGCGRGLLNKLLREGGWTGMYTGIDISATAIKDAKKCEDGRTKFHVCSIEDYDPRLKFDVIALVESLYYVQPEAVRRLLNRLYNHSLNPRGHILIRICDLKKHAVHVCAVLSEFPWSEQQGQWFIISKQD